MGKKENRCKYQNYDDDDDDDDDDDEDEDDDDDDDDDDSQEKEYDWSSLVYNSQNSKTLKTNVFVANPGGITIGGTRTTGSKALKFVRFVQNSLLRSQFCIGKATKNEFCIF